MKNLLETVLGWLTVAPETNARAVESESERRLRELQPNGRVQLLP